MRSFPQPTEPQNVSRKELRTVVYALFHVELMLFLTIVAITNPIRTHAEADGREAQSESQLVEARLRRLRGDLQPHFLFNTLNAVATLIHTDSAAARATIATLLDLLRRTFELTRTEVPLGEELDFASRYLELQKIRFGDRLHVSIEVSDPALLSTAVPPLLLQPLIENSVIHGISKLPSGGAIGVRAFRDGHTLRLEVRDNGPGCDPLTPFRIGSLGVPNTRARLEYLYQDADALSFSHDKGEFIASVRIPLRGVPTLIDRSQLDRIPIQLQPHFVLATLQATSDVLERDPAAADAMVVGLSDLLRRSLAAGDEDVPLSDELDMIDRYLELYRLGPGNKPVLTLDVEEDVLDAAVPPMLLQPLVEHAVALAGEGEVHLRGCREGATLRIDIRYRDPASSVAAGHTIDLTRARLRQLYAGQQSLDVSTVHPFVIVAVRIPFREMASQASAGIDRESETA